MPVWPSTWFIWNDCELASSQKTRQVWVGFNSSGIIGTFFFFGETVTSESYHKLLSGDVIPELGNRGHLKKAIFQQDDTKLHIADVILMLSQETFKKRVISNHFPRLFNCCCWLWPPYRLDLSPCDYFL